MEEWGKVEGSGWECYAATFCDFPPSTTLSPPPNLSHPPSSEESLPVENHPSTTASCHLSPGEKKTF